MRKHFYDPFLTTSYNKLGKRAYVCLLILPINSIQYIYVRYVFVYINTILHVYYIDNFLYKASTHTYLLIIIYRCQKRTFIVQYSTRIVQLTGTTCLKALCALLCVFGANKMGRTLIMMRATRRPAGDQKTKTTITMTMTKSII